MRLVSLWCETNAGTWSLDAHLHTPLSVGEDVVALAASVWEHLAGVTEHVVVPFEAHLPATVARVRRVLTQLGQSGANLEPVQVPLGHDP